MGALEVSVEIESTLGVDFSVWALTSHLGYIFSSSAFKSHELSEVQTRLKTFSRALGLPVKVSSSSAFTLPHHTSEYSESYCLRR